MLKEKERLKEENARKKAKEKLRKAEEKLRRLKKRQRPKQSDHKHQSVTPDSVLVKEPYTQVLQLHVKELLQLREPE